MDTIRPKHTDDTCAGRLSPAVVDSLRCGYRMGPAKASILASEPLWFDEHVFTIIVQRRHVPADILDLLQQKATVLPAWYPVALGIQPSNHPA